MAKKKTTSAALTKKTATRKRAHKRVKVKAKTFTVRGNETPSDFGSVYILCADRDEALRVAQTLVEEDLVACFNLFENVTSVFKWKGELEKSAEVALIGKTRLALKDDVIRRTKELHSYDTPCVVFWPIVDGYAPYLQWVKSNTK